MGPEPPHRKSPGGPRVRESTVRIVPGRARVANHAEVAVEGEFAHVTMSVADIPEGRFRYRLANRYLLVWAEGSPHGQHYFVILPRPMDRTSDLHHVSFSNGVVDARIRLRPAPHKG